MKLQLLLLPALVLSINTNCRLPRNKPKVPYEQDSYKPASSTDTNIVATDTSHKSVHFGVMVSTTEGKLIPPYQQAQIAKALGVNYIRARIDLTDWNGNNPMVDAFNAAGMKVLLNINYGVPRDAMGGRKPLAFPADLKAYAATVSSVLDKYKPEVLVVENEEDNPFYHTGDADDYINELKTAIDIAHAKGIKVTNGGITVREACLIVYDDLLQHGKKQEAMDFAQKSVPPAFMQRLSNLMNNPQVQHQVEFGRKILAAYKTLDLDYVNFHWYEPIKGRTNAGGADADFDPKVFEFVANYIKTATGKPVMSNEFGVLNTSPELVKGILQAVFNAKLSYAIFYSADGGGEGRAVALQNAGGDLRENGQAFRDFMKQH